MTGSRRRGIRTFTPTGLSVVALLLLVGCAQEPYLEAMIGSRPALVTRPVPVEAPPVDVDHTLTLGDLILCVPKGWNVGEVSIEPEGTPRSGWGKTFNVPLEIPLKTGMTSAIACYRQEDSWVRHPPLGMHDHLRHGTPDPEALLKRYATDLALYEDAYGVVPSDLDWCLGPELDRRRALLILKDFLPGPAKRLTLPGATVFLRVGPLDERSWYGIILDKQGMRRGLIGMRFSTPSDHAMEETLFLRLLAKAHFRQAKEPARPAS
ncbi:MAG: hypothetical protein R6X20_17965 [Phycisphaerae bacterium]